LAISFGTNFATRGRSAREPQEKYAGSFGLNGSLPTRAAWSLLARNRLNDKPTAARGWERRLCSSRRDFKEFFNLGTLQHSHRSDANEASLLARAEKDFLGAGACSVFYPTSGPYSLGLLIVIWV